jgi:hypothetical protein
MDWIEIEAVPSTSQPPSKSLAKPWPSNHCWRPEPNVPSYTQVSTWWHTRTLTKLTCSQVSLRQSIFFLISVALHERLVLQRQSSCFQLLGLSFDWWIQSFPYSCHWSQILCDQVAEEVAFDSAAYKVIAQRHSKSFPLNRARTRHCHVILLCLLLPSQSSLNFLFWYEPHVCTPGYLNFWWRLMLCAYEISSS